MSENQSGRNHTVLTNLSFEKALALLDETVQSLERGNLSLSESMSTYERGMELAQWCNQKLASAELRITEIRTCFNEQTTQDDDSDSFVENHSC